MLAVAVPVAMGGFFMLLGQTFDYPDVMDLPAGEVLTRLGEAGDEVTASWLGATLSAVLFLALVVCFDRLARDEAGAVGRVAILNLVTVFGVLATLFMMLDLGQWVWLNPELGRRYVDPATDPAMRASLEVTWDAFHRYVGVGVGIYAATFFNALWAMGVGVLLLGARQRVVLAWLALASGVLFLASIAPGVGFDGYAFLNSVGFALWALWLVLLGWVLIREGTIARPAG